MLNPKNLNWQQSGKNTDGSDFTSDQYAGTELALDGEPVASIPVQYATDGKYSFPVASLPAPLANGTHTFAVDVVAANGNKSALSDPGSFDVDNRTPEAPFALSAS
jgi:hypothetical protein